MKKERIRGAGVERAERQVHRSTREFERAMDRFEKKLEETGETIQGVIELLRHPGATMRLFARKAEGERSKRRRAAKKKAA